jgi:DNA-directed RNA polymerase subunit N (RpoN/RPB10)
MIFPIRCISCNAVIAGKWLAYLDLVKKFRKEEGKPEDGEMEYLTATTTKTAEGKALDELGIRKTCCRRHFLTHVDL